MKTNNKMKLFYGWIYIFSIILTPTANIIFAQIDPSQLASKVEKHIEKYYTDEFKISASQTGVIRVEGELSTLFDKLKIGELISQIEGVKEVKNEIEVKTIFLPDDGIKDNIENELRLNNVILEPEKIKVEVKNGVVNLSGTVSHLGEKLMAQSIASWQDGVIDMVSNVKVLPHAAAVSDDNLKQIINDILKRYFPLEDKVKFNVENGKVDLYGSAKSLYAKNHIQEEIQHILGIRDVVNEIYLENNSE